MFGPKAKRSTCHLIPGRPSGTDVFVVALLLLVSCNGSRSEVTTTTEGNEGAVPSSTPLRPAPRELTGGPPESTRLPPVAPWGSAELLNGKARMGTPKASERLSNAAQRLVELDRTVTVESMQAALEAMEAVPLPGDPEARRSERASIAHLWLRLLAQLDASLDPNFDPEDRPVRGGVSAVIGDRELTPGADSALIDDPKVRAAYERNLRESRQKAESYNRQVRLRYLEPRIETGAFRALRQLYRDSTEDRAELDQVLSGESLTPERRARLERWLGAR